MRIAVTGGIAEGKSTVVRFLGDFGHSTDSSDVFARECFYEPSTQLELATLLGGAPPVDAARLRSAISQSDDFRRQVNRVMHPGVVSRILQSSATFFEVPLLIETCLHPLFDQVWVVTCGPEEQRARLIQRDGDASAAKIMASQLTSFVKTPFADVVIRTNAPIETVKRFVQHAGNTLLKNEIARIEG